MTWNSFRVRLTLWNVAVLVVVLGGFGLALCYSIRNGMSAALDREMALQARRPPGGGPPPPALGSPPGPFPGVRPIARPEGSGPQWPFDREAERSAAFRRPRFITLTGEAVGPPMDRQPWDPDTVAAAIAGQERYSTVTIEGERVRVLSVPWRFQGRIIGAVQVARELGEYDRLVDGQLRTLLLLLPLSLCLAGVGGLFLTGRALRPVREVTRAAAQIGAEDLSRRLQIRGHDELAELAATFNGMIARLEAAFEQQRRFTSDASHELRTPLARIKLTTSLALNSEQSPDEYRAGLRVIDRAADEMARLVNNLLLLARSDAGQLPLQVGPVEVTTLFQRAVEAVPSAAGRQLVLDVPSGPLQIRGDEEYLTRVFANLLENATRHTPADGQITLSARAEGERVMIGVADTGEGIAPEHLPRLGQRFYRVDTARSRGSGGCGLGLAICKSIVEAHKGTLSIQSEVGQGTSVILSLPPCPPARDLVPLPPGAQAAKIGVEHR
ncbi:MAG: HAMP domain-containing histidine kinase [Armatimonadetes bacterium]|nr:HAMP domain-containing histidine kinase [Armatimonadota bacterium]